MVKWLLSHANQVVEFDNVAEGMAYCNRNKIENFKLELVTDIKMNDHNGFADMIDREVAAFDSNKEVN